MSDSLYIYYGDENFLVDQAVAKIKKQLLDPSMEAFGYQVLSEHNADIDNVVNSVQTLPSFTPVRLVVIKNPDFLKKTLDDEQEALVINCFENIPEGVTVVIQVYGAIDMRRKIAKVLKKTAKDCQEYKSFASWDQDKVINWIKTFVLKKGYVIEAKSAEMLTALSGISLQALANEIEKIITYIGDRKEISLDDVKTIASQGEISGFSLGEALRKRDIKSSVVIINKMIKDGTSSNVILGMLAAQIRLLMQVKEFDELRRNFNDIAKELGKNPYYIKYLLTDVKKYQLQELKKCFYALQESDYKIKTGQLRPQIAMELALSTLIR